MRQRVTGTRPRIDAQEMDPLRIDGAALAGAVSRAPSCSRRRDCRCWRCPRAPTGGCPMGIQLAESQTGAEWPGYCSRSAAGSRRTYPRSEPPAPAVDARALTTIRRAVRTPCADESASRGGGPGRRARRERRGSARRRAAPGCTATFRIRGARCRPDQRVGHLEPGRHASCARDHGEADVGVRARVRAVGDQRRAVQPRGRRGCGSRRRSSCPRTQRPAPASPARCSTSRGEISRAIASYPATHALAKIATTTAQPAQRSARAAQHEGRAERDGRRGVAEVVDQVGQQGDAAGRDKHQRLDAAVSARTARASETARTPARERLIESAQTRPWSDLRDGFQSSRLRPAAATRGAPAQLGDTLEGRTPRCGLRWFPPTWRARPTPLATAATLAVGPQPVAAAQLLRARPGLVDGQLTERLRAAAGVDLLFEQAHSA